MREKLLSDYSTNPDIKEAIDEWYDGFDGPEKVLWEDQMEKYNNTRDVAAGEPEIKNPALYTGMKMWSGVIMPNTRDVNIKTFAPKKPETTPSKVGAELKQTNDGVPTPGKDTYKAIDVDYGQYVEHHLEPIPKDAKMPLDQHSFINYIPAGFSVSSLGKPASQAKLTEGQSVAGQSYKINNAWVYEEFPVYIGDKTRTFPKIVYGKGTFGGKKKGEFTLYPNQPFPDDLYERVRDLEDNSGRKLKDEEIAHMPVAKISLQTDVREALEVMRIFDAKLANDIFKTVNPEFELGTTLIKEPKPGRESFDMPSGEYTEVQRVNSPSGEIITIGKRDGKWYNVETGEEIE
jgi:hypothetical protein